jgi:hypothetical protein
LATVAGVSELERAASRQADQLERLLADEAKFTDNLTKDKISQSAAAIACLAQAIQDHPEGEGTKVSPADLREAAQGILAGETHADAKQGLAAVRSALAGEKNGATQREPWGELVSMEPLMEGFNEINNTLRRTVRRSDNPEDDALDATTGAVLSLAMKADLSYVEESQVADWQMLSDQLFGEYQAIADAMKRKDTDAAREHHKQIAKVCTACHDKYRSE